MLQPVICTYAVVRLDFLFSKCEILQVSLFYTETYIDFRGRERGGVVVSTSCGGSRSGPVFPIENRGFESHPRHIEILTHTGVSKQGANTLM
jgi:hypothetical protein